MFKRVAVNILVIICATVFLFIFLEIYIRVAGVETEIDHKVYGVNKEQPIYFNPGQSHLYKTKEFSFTITSNKYGRRDKEWSPAVLSDAKNIIFIGDSVILGYGVDEEWSIPSLIERSARKGINKEFEIFNFGIVNVELPGYKQLFEDALAIGIQAKYIVVGVFVGNDFMEETKKTPTRQQNVVVRHLKWISRHSKLYSFLRFRISSSPQILRQTLQFGRLMKVDLYDSPSSFIYLKKQSPEEENYFQHSLSYLGQMKEVCSKNGRRLYIVIFPNKIQVENKKDFPQELFDMEKPNRFIGQYCKKNGIKYLDLLPELSIAYEQTHESLYYAIDRHFTRKGNYFSAKLIEAFLREQGIL